jgi:hypothetical protein
MSEGFVGRSHRKLLMSRLIDFGLDNRGRRSSFSVFLLRDLNDVWGFWGN